MFGKMHNMNMVAKFLVYYCLILFSCPSITICCLADFFQWCKKKMILRKKSFNAALCPFLFISFL